MPTMGELAVGVERCGSGRSAAGRRGRTYTTIHGGWWCYTVVYGPEAFEYEARLEFVPLADNSAGG